MGNMGTHFSRNLTCAKDIKYFTQNSEKKIVYVYLWIFKEPKFSPEAIIMQIEFLKRIPVLYFNSGATKHSKLLSHKHKKEWKEDFWINRRFNIVTNNMVINFKGNKV